MGEALKNKVELPVWLISLLVGILLSLLTFSGSIGATNNQVKEHTKQIEVIMTSKANKDTETLILESVRRIENKLDSHIANQ